ncbi:MAG: hypothetical protein VXZ49_05535, partial [Planctomycetota bacterium]|nr:hypothetical protein [Planctomycetota bacterium]
THSEIMPTNGRSCRATFYILRHHPFKRLPVTPTFSSAYLVDSFAFRKRPLYPEAPRRLPPRLFDSSEFACVNRRYGQMPDRGSF